MSNRPFPDGRYAIMGPGGQLTDDSNAICLLPPGGSPKQRWTVTYTPGNDSYTIQNVGTQRYLALPPGQPTSMMFSGAPVPGGWRPTQGPDPDPRTFLLTSADSAAGPILALSVLRIYPPRAAILPPTRNFVVEWRFQPVA